MESQCLNTTRRAEYVTYHLIHIPTPVLATLGRICHALIDAEMPIQMSGFSPFASLVCDEPTSTGCTLIRLCLVQGKNQVRSWPRVWSADISMIYLLMISVHFQRSGCQVNIIANVCYRGARHRCWWYRCVGDGPRGKWEWKASRNCGR